ncbi:deoxyribonuclease IV [Candidatus Dependentiae bacterium]|nr:deoxyribonuclease IV [Candidatus Dependentiae bacterium]
MESKRKIGLHLRLTTSLTSLIKQAEKYESKIFQFFLVKQKNYKYIKITSEDFKNFLNIKKKQNFEAYIHSSYWINLCTGKFLGIKGSKKILQKEITLAKKLKIKYLVLHPGSATGYKKNSDDTRNQLAGIKALAKGLNDILKNENFVQILLENTAHGNKTIGSNLQDFAILKKFIKYPDRINFCLDLAHAFAYGYNLENTEQFINLIDENMELKKIKLIHLHDSAERQGSKLDKHEIPGKGFIKLKIFKNIVNHPKLKNIPIIIETPQLTFKENKKLLDAVKNW